MHLPAPREDKPLVAAVAKARAAGIPVILLDRNVDQTMAQPGKDYVAFIGSDFIQEGQRAADWLIKETGGKAKIIQLKVQLAHRRPTTAKKALRIHQEPGWYANYSFTERGLRPRYRTASDGNFVAGSPRVTAVYAHNDEMAIGAITALQAAGKPGKDVIVVSVDGEKDGLQAIIDGKLGATVECNPRFGPKAFDTLDKYAAGRDDCTENH